jgi:hypothetical protein
MVMSSEQLHFNDSRHVIDRLRHTYEIIKTPDLTSYCSAASFTAVFGPEAYPSSLLATEQSLTANEQAINEAARCMQMELYGAYSAQSFLFLLNHPYTQGALLLTDIHVPRKTPQEKIITHVTAVVPSEIRSVDQSEPLCYYAVDTGTAPSLDQIDVEGALDMFTNAHACFVVTRSIIPQHLQKE